MLGFVRSLQDRKDRPTNTYGNCLYNYYYKLVCHCVIIVFLTEVGEIVVAIDKA
jgi:hypothetical protein